MLDWMGVSNNLGYHRSVVHEQSVLPLQVVFSPFLSSFSVTVIFPSYPFSYTAKSRGRFVYSALAACQLETLNKQLMNFRKGWFLYYGARISLPWVRGSSQTAVGGGGG